MSQRSKLSPEQQPWEDHFVAIFKCSRKPPATEVIDVANKSDIKQNPDLQRVLRVLQLGMITRREYPNAANPTIRYATFRPSDAKRPNEARLWLDELLHAKHKAEVEKWASKLASSYVKIENVQQGVLIFLKSLLKVNGSSDGCVFVFKCDFEDILLLCRLQEAHSPHRGTVVELLFCRGASVLKRLSRKPVAEFRSWRSCK